MNICKKCKLVFKKRKDWKKEGDGIHCPRCDRHGYQSVYGNFCTLCANLERGFMR